MTETSNDTHDASAKAFGREELATHPVPARSANLATPLWVAAASLAVIAIVLLVGVVELSSALEAVQSSVQLMQQQTEAMKQGLGGLLGG